MSLKRNTDKTRTYALGLLAGALFGAMAAYFYTRAADEDATVRGSASPRRASTGEVIGLGLAALAMVRQIAEMGRPPAKKR